MSNDATWVRDLPLTLVNDPATYSVLWFGETASEYTRPFSEGFQSSSAPEVAFSEAR